jgi:hypothetical protein
MQVGYNILMVDFFIEMNLPREEKIVSIISDGMHLQFVTYWVFSTRCYCSLICLLFKIFPYGFQCSAIKLFTSLSGCQYFFLYQVHN